MAGLTGCVGARGHEALLGALEEAVRDDSPQRLDSILSAAPHLPADTLNRKHLVHQAAWLGYTGCVRVLIEYGASPDSPHRRNGCTPLHLAHFCTVQDTTPGPTIQALVAAGADVDGPGSAKCGKCALEHAIQHQRVDAVEALLGARAAVSVRAVLCAIDVASPQIISLLLLAGGDCGQPLPSTRYWGAALHRVIHTPLKCPRECYKSMFRLLAQATVAPPPTNHPSASLMPNTHKDSDGATAPDTPQRKKPPAYKLSIEAELREVAKDYVELAQYLYALLLRNGFVPAESTRTALAGVGGDVAWEQEYLVSPPSLRDLAVRVVRTAMVGCGNILHACSRLGLPARIQDIILHTNPL